MTIKSKMDMHKLASALILLGCKVTHAETIQPTPYCYNVKIHDSQAGNIYIYEDQVLIAPTMHATHIVDPFTFEEFYAYVIKEKEGELINDERKSDISA